MKRRAIIHIGTGKTGSTTLQTILAVNREAMQAQGFAYPTSPGRRNHMRLAVYAANGRRADEFARMIGEGGDAPTASRRFAAELGQELESLPDSIHTVIFSNEHLANKADTPEATQRLKALLDNYFDSYRIVVYLRRQDEYAVSLYTTRLRAGDTHQDILGPMTAPRSLARLNWADLLDRWAAAFGRSSLAPRIFARDAFVEGDLVADFRAVCGLGSLPLTGEDAVQNPSLQPAAQEFIRRLNLSARGVEEEPAETEFDDDDPDSERGTGRVPLLVRSVLDTRFPGPGRRPSRAEAEAFVNLFAESNERIRAEFFPQRAQIFSADFSRYPETADPLPSDAEVLEVAIAVIRDQQVKADAQAAEALYRRALNKQLEGSPAEAWRFLRRALSKMPGHLGALRALIENADTPERRQEANLRLRQARDAEPERKELHALARRLSRGRHPEPGDMLDAPGREGEREFDRPAASRTEESLGPRGAEAGAEPTGKRERPRLTAEERASRRARREQREEQRAVRRATAA